MQRLQLDHQRVYTQPQRQIEHDWSILNEQVLIALAAVNSLRA